MSCSESIKKTLDMVKTMLELVDEGDAVREDVGCGYCTLCCVIRLIR
jgi:hypothetical protein